MPQDRQRGMRSGRAEHWLVSLALAGLLVTSAVGGGIAMAQEDMATPVVSGMALGVPTVSVSGHGSVNVPPDTASVSIGVDIIKPTLDEAQEHRDRPGDSSDRGFEEAGIKRKISRPSTTASISCATIPKMATRPCHRVRDRQPAQVTVHDTPSSVRSSMRRLTPERTASTG